jgi:4-amino-4-deoxy-L-arabinose transferase-like glycosyltransferase
VSAEPAGSPRLAPNLALVLALPALIAFSLSLFFCFGERWDSDAPYYTAIALGAARDGHWWTLFQGEHPYFNKPPLGFWYHALSALGFDLLGLGSTDAAHRLPWAFVHALASALLAGLTHELFSAGRRAHLAQPGALCAGLALACTSECLWRVPNFRLDSLHAAACIGSAWALVRVLQSARLGRPSLGPSLAAAGALAAALLTKPFYALVLPVMFVPWLAAMGMLSRRSLARLTAITFLAIALAAVWHVSMHLQHPNRFIDKYLTEQSLKRATGELFQPEPWWWYLAYLTGQTGRGALSPIWSAPILVLAGVAIARLAWTLARTGRHALELRPAESLGALWLLGWLLALSLFPDKRSYYLLIVFPGAAILVGALLAELLKLDHPLRMRWTARVVGLCAVVALFSALFSIKPQRDARPLPPGLGEVLTLVRSTQAVTNAGLTYNRAALVAIKTGIWPSMHIEKEPTPRELALPGSLLIYERRPPIPGASPWPSPDHRDEVLLDAGNFVVTRRTDP